MPDSTELKSWPYALNALDWSADGIIAVAAEENIELLFSNLAPDEDLNLDSLFDPPHWHSHPIRACDFKLEELPLKDVAPLPIYSIGEEISSAWVVSLAWSPPGLSKYRRCALAVYNTNLTLSLWISTNKPEDPKSWTRAFIFNPVLDKYFQDDAQDEESPLASDAEEKRRIRQRIRAYAWCPSRILGRPGTLGTQVSWDPCFMAVANDDNHIALISIQLPFEGGSPDGTWEPKVLGHFSVISETNHDAASLETGTFEDTMSQQRFVSHLAWSEQISSGDDGFEHILAYSTNAHIKASLITFEYSDESNRRVETVALGEEQNYGSADLRFSGPMKWCPRREGEDSVVLVAFCRTAVVCFRASIEDGSMLGHFQYELDRWDPVSGMAFDIRAPHGPKVHFASLLSTTQPASACIQISRDGLDALRTPDWQNQIRNNLAYYSARLDLQGRAVAKVYGLVGSPLGDYIALIHSLHPTEFPEYVLLNQRRTTVTVTKLEGAGPGLQFVKGYASAEATLISVKKWWDNNSETEEEATLAKEQILNTLAADYGPLPNTPTSSIDYADITSCPTLISTFKTRAYFHPHTLRKRYNILISTITQPTTPLTPERMMIALRYLREVANLPPSLSSSSPFSKRMLATHKRAMDCIYRIGGYHVPDLNDTSYPERCGFCNEVIPMQHTEWARCPNGHEFPRCGLSFFAIQMPRITKVCGVCEGHFLCDGFVRDELKGEGGESGGGLVDEDMQGTGDKDKGKGKEKVQSGEEMNELGISLAGLVYAACDACLYCGGKYVGV